MLNHTGRGYTSQNPGMFNPTPIHMPYTIKASESNINVSRIIFLKFVLTALWKGVDGSNPFPSVPPHLHGELRLTDLPLSLLPGPSCCPINSKKGNTN